jgi:hypothetical protein
VFNIATHNSLVSVVSFVIEFTIFASSLFATNRASFYFTTFDARDAAVDSFDVFFYFK